MLVRYCTAVALKRHEGVNAFNLVHYLLHCNSEKISRLVSALKTQHSYYTATSIMPSPLGLYNLLQCRQTFLPCDAMRCTVLVIVILSDRPSVRPSVTLVHCVHMVRPTIMISSPYGSPIILVSGNIKFIPKFEWDHPE